MKDINYCASSYLMYRYVFNPNKSFRENMKCNIVDISFDRHPVSNAADLIEILKKSVEQACKTGKTALALSGGMDSAILAKFMPKGSKAYTFRCVVPGVTVIDESERAAKWAKLCKLD